MRYRILGFYSDGRTFRTEFFASCAREAEVMFHVLAMAEDSTPTITAVYDIDSARLNTFPAPAPQLLNFRDMLLELDAALSAGKISSEACQDLRWLRRVNNARLADRRFFKRVGALSTTSDRASPEAEMIRESLFRLAAIGIALIYSRSIPPTNNLLDLMYQVRVTAILFGASLPSALQRRHLKLVPL